MLKIIKDYYLLKYDLFEKENHAAAHYRPKYRLCWSCRYNTNTSASFPPCNKCIVDNPGGEEIWSPREDI